MSGKNINNNQDNFILEHSSLGKTTGRKDKEKIKNIIKNRLPKKDKERK